MTSGTTLRTFRLAMAATSGYTGVFGSVAGAMSALATTVNRVDGIYEKEMAVRFVLVANNGGNVRMRSTPRSPDPKGILSIN